MKKFKACLCIISACLLGLIFVACESKLNFKEADFQGITAVTITDKADYEKEVTDADEVNEIIDYLCNLNASPDKTDIELYTERTVKMYEGDVLKYEFIFDRYSGVTYNGEHYKLSNDFPELPKFNATGAEE